MNKKIVIIAIFIVCLTFVSLAYLKNDESQDLKETYIQTVIFQDQDHDLVPVSLNVHNQMEMETDIRNKIDLMQSSQLQTYGLYPVIDPQLEIQSIELNDQTLTVSFNDNLYSNQDALNILEALTYVLTDYDEVEQLNLQIDGKEVSHLPNSTIPLNHLTKKLGLNNFEEASTFLHQSIPVMIYQEKTIADYLYYVPTTLRINENDDLNEQVQTILSHINSKIHLLKASLKDQVLTLELDDNVLLDNETIDRTLEELIILSLKSLDGVEDVELLINSENVRSQETSQIHYNYIKM
ncbi:GerMN domain-containing protein [Allocoprobacillus halotolerans]|uniref:GerMN domain-containing protein n=1 Tax=Allocoprobacillus halotolerans TaxID=2944914 RepID=A0ABY5I0C3_9FIRM|nr:GerMN domain-containing protein [Allocoprobacillus halotolerans]UTY38794.1 GerMN domain-containing protein [Allocoprobacillus halotolerans]